MVSSLPISDESASLISPFFDEIPLLATVEKSEDVVEFFVSDSSAKSWPVFTIPDSVRTEYNADVRHTDQLAQTY